MEKILGKDFIQRPEAEKKKINCKEHFEFCYLRHKYFRKVKFNPTKEDMAPYMKIVKGVAFNTYSTYKNLFNIIGFELEDIISIATVHLVNFLGLFALEQDQNKYDNFISSYIKKYDSTPSEQHLFNKNKANLTLFLKQRMEDTIRICRQKSRNIRGLEIQEFFAFYGKNEPINLREVALSPEKYEYKRVDPATFKSIRKKAKQKGKESFTFNGLWYICIQMEQKSLELIDFAGADLDPYSNMHNKDPEQLYFEKESVEQFEDKKDKFFSHDRKRQIIIVKKFIEKNISNENLKDEIRHAKRFLKTL